MQSRMTLKLGAAAALMLVQHIAAAGNWRSEFLTPPASAQPRVWWHWMNGNISQEGIQQDLEWMKRIGIGGAQAFDASLQTPQLVPQRHVFMSEAWRADMRFAGAQAHRLGLELAIASSGGWSLAGAPWVEPAQAMKKLVWSETTIAGGQRVVRRLAPPPDVAGPYQDIPASLMEAHGDPQADPRFYRDARVVAYPATAPAPPHPPIVSASHGTVDAQILMDGRLADSIALPVTTDGKPSWLGFDYQQARTLRAITVAHPAPRGFGAAPLPVMTLEASSDGIQFAPIATLVFGTGAQQTVSFAQHNARWWRLLVTPEAGGGPPPSAAGVVLPPFGAAASAYTISEVRLHEQARIHRHEDKAGFATANDYYALDTPASTGAAGPAPDSVLDLSSAMRPDGTLDWDAPPGNWVVLRMGYSLTGHRNGPAAPEATGLEIDKLSAKHSTSYLNRYLEQFAGNPGINALLNDSIESGAQNWTEDMPEAFRQRRGYRLEPWLPALTGQIIGSAADSDRFLWDYRRTIAQLLAERFYASMASAARARGLTLYGEALEDRRPQLGDDLEMRRHTSIPMAAMWAVPAGAAARPTFVADIRGAASVAHVWGQNLVAAESMTAFGQPWAFSPRDLKRTADLEFALGVNRIVIHTSTHQPLSSSLPGLSLAPFLGQYFTRNDTWAELATPWISYLARNSLMLQQGHNQADIAYFYGEEGPVTGLYGERPNTEVPSGYAYDYVNAEALTQRLAVKDGRLVAPSGAAYQVLYLGGASQRMTLPTLRRIAQLVRAGATLVGEPPVDSPSLADQPGGLKRLTAALWGTHARTSTGQRVGKGRVLAGRSLAAALQDLAIAPDLLNAAGLSYVHRRSGQDEIYFIANSGQQKVQRDVSFRTQGKQAEFWHADTGTSAAAPYRLERQRTTVPLSLDADESVFVVFSARASQPQRLIATPQTILLATLQQGWHITFQQARGAPQEPMPVNLGSLSDATSAGVRYFSGTASYTNVFTVTPETLQYGSVMLDLGDVRDIAQVKLNGTDLGIAWKAPYRFDLSKAVQAGSNQLEVRVTNPWVNRLIGDAQPGAIKVTDNIGPVYAPDAPLRPAGLIGPVRLQHQRPR